MPRFETVAALARAARRALPAPVWSLVNGGTQAGVSRAANVAAFERLALQPRLCRTLRRVDPSGVVFGAESRLPVAIAPLAAQGLRPGAELLQARAAAAFGIPISVSNFGSVGWRELVAAGARVAAQLYWVGGREEMARRLVAARRAGVSTLLLTLDWSFPAGRDWGTPAIPAQLGVRDLVRWAPAAASRPLWTLRTLTGRGLPPLRVPNFADATIAPPTFGEVMERWRATEFPTWDDVSWLRDQWGGRLIVKGVMHPDDAVQAAAVGCDGVIVSNHGGNDLDTAPASLTALPGIVAAVGGRVEIGFDGGVRRGSDVVKARALGADYVLVGRPAAWAVAAAGQAGVTNLCEILERDITQALRALGVASLREIGPEVLADLGREALDREGL